MLKIENLHASINGKEILKGVNLTVRDGEVHAIMGLNGAGKSTLLRTIGGFQPALAGEVSIDGKPTDRLGPDRLNRLLSVVLTERIDVAGLTVRDLVGMGRAPYTGFWGTLQADDRRIVDESMKLAGVAELADRQVQSLSDGERQKAVIAKALAQQTPAILLDEPTAFLDYPSKVGTLRLLSRLAHDMQKTVLLSTHDVEMALQLGDKLWLMDCRGLSIGSPRQLAADGTIARFFACPGVEFSPESLTFRMQAPSS